MNQSASLLKGGQVMLVGGWSLTYNVLSTAEIYTPLTLTFSSSSLTFGFEEIESTTASQTVMVTNVSHSSVTFTGIAASGDFAQTNTCPATLASGKKCVITVKFKPHRGRNRTDAVTLKDNSDGSPMQTIGTSASLSATVTNDGATPVTITNITITPAGGTFTQTNSCPSTLGVNQTCTVQVVFTPPDSITFNATLQILGSPLPLAGAGSD